MGGFLDLLNSELAVSEREDALRFCKGLFDRFNGRSRLAGTMETQAAAIEEILGRCIPNSDGSATVTVHTRIDADVLADLAVAAFRLRKMAPYEADIRDMVVGSK